MKTCAQKKSNSNGTVRVRSDMIGSEARVTSTGGEYASVEGLLASAYRFERLAFDSLPGADRDRALALATTLRNTASQLRQFCEVGTVDAGRAEILAKRLRVSTEWVVTNAVAMEDLEKLATLLEANN